MARLEAKCILKPLANRQKDGARRMKKRTHFAHRVDMLDSGGELLEHLAGVEDYELAETTWFAAMKRWPKARVILRQGARVVKDSRRPRIVTE
jgi:hypothetical protein